MTKKPILVLVVIVVIFLGLIAARRAECPYGQEDCVALRGETPTLVRTPKPRHFKATATPTQMATETQTPPPQAQASGEMISDCPSSTYPTATLSVCQIATVMADYSNTMATAWAWTINAVQTAAAMPTPTLIALPTEGYPGGGEGYPAP